MVMDFPLLYCNGSSYSSNDYHPLNNNAIYVNYVANKLNGFVLNKSFPGNWNRSIIRTSVHDLIHQRQLNPSQKIIAIIGLTIEMWSDIWLEDNEPKSEELSNFQCHSFTTLQDWRERLVSNLDILGFNKIFKKEKDTVFERFYTKYSEGRAYFYSPYAERINLFCDLLMFTSMCKKYNINYLIFQGDKAEKLEQEYLLDFFSKELYKDDRIFNWEEFGFIHWCRENNFEDLEPLNPKGHFGPDVHEAFANRVLLPTLEKTKQL